MPARGVLAPTAVSVSASLVLCGGAAGLTPAAAIATATATPKCRTQTYSYTHGKKNVLNSVKGPKVRTSAAGLKTLTDNQIVAQYQLVNGGRFVNITTNDPNGFQVTRLRSVTIYPTKGKHKSWKITPSEKNDFTYKFDLLRDVGQVMLPVNGSDGNGRTVPKIKKVVVKARENCYPGA